MTRFDHLVAPDIEAVLDSWYAVLRLGLEYMKQVYDQKSQPKPVQAHKPSPKR
jgi:hypothetical protein